MADSYMKGSFLWKYNHFFFVKHTEKIFVEMMDIELFWSVLFMMMSVAKII